ncbi:uncharacterized protein LOC121733569 isoform X2 [Aricia agestis]|nr:uncharacterized protein LOC121733569 isoform X2 [Aricia agestis]
MDIVNMDEGQYEQRAQPGSSMDSEASSTVDSNDSSERMSDTITDDDDDLREDLQKNIPDCYKSDLNFASQNSSDISEDNEEFQTTALCQFMDILNDLDEVLDKSLLACLDDGAKSLDSGDEDVVFKLKEIVKEEEDSQSSCDDDTQVVVCPNSHRSIPQATESVQQNEPRNSKFGRSKSFSEILKPNVERPIERVNTVNDSLRNSMRCLDPIVLPTLTDTSCEPLTLPVILFLEHHVNMRPTSAPIQLQVTTNISSDSASGPLIVGRRTLLMNRTLSLPSPGESDVTNDWTGRNTARSTARSSTSSSSTESLVVSPTNQNMANATDERNEDIEDPPFGVWPHRMSAMLACLSCTVGIFNISRFAMFSVHFGASFIVQFLILSLLVGIPLFTLHLCLGQTLRSGPIDMWRISPILQGIGVALLLAQMLIGVYSIIGLSWVFVYFRDSFITSEDKYKWALPYGSGEDVISKNITMKIYETLPVYFHNEVLKQNPGTNGYGTIKFHIAFNLAVLWMIVFVGLCKGIRSYGKAVYMLIFLPICGILILCTKLLTLIPYEAVTNIFAETEWSEFFINSNSWAAAAQETFLTWGLLGACIMQLISHKDAKRKNSLTLQRESTCIVIFTFTILLLGSFLANICVQILRNHGYIYMPSSYETIKSSQFLYPITEPPPSTALRHFTHYGGIVGLTVRRTLSGWQPLQLATQIVPAALAVSADVLSPVWAVIFYFIIIMFGIAQQLAIWHCVVTGIMEFNVETLKIWDTTITFFSCVFGLAVGLLLSTDMGVRIVYWLDYTISGGWCHGALAVALVVGVFAVRGRPLSADTLVRVLFPPRTATVPIAALLSFVWTVLLPVAIAAICIVDFRVGQQRQLYSWRKTAGYWPVWVRQVSVCIQQGLLLLVPVTAFIQTWRYMSKGPPDIFERIQNLYRPSMEASPRRAPPPVVPPPDPPPKYTPPPSYSTATGARLLNTLRRSFRTLRRITSSRIENDDGHAPITLSESVERHSEPPITSDYLPQDPPILTNYLSEPPILRNEMRHSTPSIVRNQTLPSSRNETTHGTPNIRTSSNQTPNIQPSNEAPSQDIRSQVTPTILRHESEFTRAHLRRSFLRAESLRNVRASLRRSLRCTRSGSHERLVRNAEPLATRATLI